MAHSVWFATAEREASSKAPGRLRWKVVDFPGSGFPGFGPAGSSGGSFLEQVLADLLQLMGKVSPTAGSHVALAQSLAQAVATGGEPEGNVDPADRIELEELARIAEMHVTDVTGSPASPGGVPLDVMAVGPGMWAWHTIGDWAYLLDAIGGAPSVGRGAGSGEHGVEPGSRPGPGAIGSAGRSAGSAGGEYLEEVGHGDLPGGGGDLLARWLATVGPMFGALQVASAVGHLAQSTLGQYEVPIPRSGTGRILVVADSCKRFAEGWSLPRDQVVLWVCLRDLTINGIMSRPHVAGRFRRLVQAVVAGSVEGASGLVDRMGEIDPGDPSSLQRLLDDPDLLALPEPSPAQERSKAELSALVAVLLGYVEHVVDIAGARLLGNKSAIVEAWRRREVEGERSASAVSQLTGADSSFAQVDRGEAFVRGVLDRAGEEGLSRLWESERTLPTPPEVAAPGLWLERISMDDSPEEDS